MSQARAVVVMGVSGSGKTTVGQQLAERFAWPFFDADDFHPQANIDKMSQGIPLDDADRRPWLEALHTLIQEHLKHEDSLVLACSALKRSYRDLLAQGDGEVTFVFLKGSFDLIFERMREREGHYMKADMLRSQFEALEEPENALVADASDPVEIIVDELMTELVHV